MPFLNNQYLNGKYPAVFFLVAQMISGRTAIYGWSTYPPPTFLPPGIAGHIKGLFTNLVSGGGYVARGGGPMIPISRLRRWNRIKSWVQDTLEAGPFASRKDWKFGGTFGEVLVEIFVYI